ncbi:hypothetical protein C2S53_014649 [Perilla frutescens var. hirtella]|uniref:Dof zinc finger protein n=1 Tax=Perilla frutescens var. hirtella TaxID=608512 RepID=A0AAD4IXY9_PERFH|nr:hypothetical protein C2S53_014649 [Perilla frutescens var. hirtella]
MSPDNKPPAGKDETPSSTSRKTATARPQEPSVKCPRCDSPNTKFCYYNNYSLTQPRHFCKTCRRYWTKGGALRSVPIGGGCRKNKKMRSSPPLSGDSNSNGSSSDIGGLKFFHGVSPAMDFQLNFPRIHSSPTTAIFNSQFSSFADSSNTTAAAISSTPSFNFDFSAPNSPLMGFNFPANQEMGFRSSLASSIESLSSINQDLHWKMQKQRLAMLLPGDNQKNSNSSNSIEPDFRKPQPILFQNLEVPSKQESCGIKAPRKDGGGADGNLSTEWFFDNTYATPATSNGINGENSGGWSSGIQTWGDLSQYSSIP